MIIQLFDEALLLLPVGHFELDELLLEVIGNGGEDAVTTMIFMFNLTLLAVERVIDLTAELYLVVRVLSAVEFLRVEGEVITIAETSIILGIVSPWFKLLESHIARTCQ